MKTIYMKKNQGTVVIADKSLRLSVRIENENELLGLNIPEF